MRQTRRVDQVFWVVSGGAPESEDLRALVDALETFLGFGDRFDGGDPKLFDERGVQRDADALPVRKPFRPCKQIIESKRGRRHLSFLSECIQHHGSAESLNSRAGWTASRWPEVFPRTGLKTRHYKGRSRPIAKTVGDC